MGQSKLYLAKLSVVYIILGKNRCTSLVRSEVNLCQSKRSLACYFMVRRVLGDSWKKSWEFKLFMHEAFIQAIGFNLVHDVCFT